MLKVAREDHSESQPDRRHLKRISRNAGLFMVLMTTAAAIFWDWGGALSILIGGVLALLNFRWMAGAVDQILRIGIVAGEQIRVGRFLAGYLGRLILILVGLFAIINFSFLSLFGALMGLSIFVLAGFLEAILLMLRRQGAS